MTSTELLARIERDIERNERWLNKKHTSNGQRRDSTTIVDYAKRLKIAWKALDRAADSDTFYHNMPNSMSHPECCDLCNVRKAQQEILEVMGG